MPFEFIEIPFVGKFTTTEARYRTTGLWRFTGLSLWRNSRCAGITADTTRSQSYHRERPVRHESGAEPAPLPCADTMGLAFAAFATYKSVGEGPPAAQSCSERGHVS